jgi:hypothetical protein
MARQILRGRAGARGTKARVHTVGSDALNDQARGKANSWTKEGRASRISAWARFHSPGEWSAGRFGERMGWAFQPSNNIAYTHFRDGYRQQIAEKVGLFGSSVGPNGPNSGEVAVRGTVA